MDSWLASFVDAAEAMPTAALVFRGGGNAAEIVYANRASAELTGASSTEQLRGKSSTWFDATFGNGEQLRTRSNECLHRRLVFKRIHDQRSVTAMYAWVPVLDEAGLTAFGVALLTETPVQVSGGEAQQQLLRFASVLLLLPRCVAVGTEMACDPRFYAIAQSVGSFNRVQRTLIDVRFPPFPPEDGSNEERMAHERPV